MSSDSAKENASVVDSSISEWKQDIENLDDPESSSYKVYEDSNPTRADKVGYSHHQIRVPTGIEMEKLYNTKYFIIKSLNHQNIRLSVEKGVWATQIMNEPILEEAFHNSLKVILIFSVNMSGYFQGYAQMMSPIGWKRDNVWSEGSSKGNPWGRSFKVKWLQLNDLPFHKTLHLKNPLNDYKPVKISRDCQVSFISRAFLSFIFTSRIWRTVHMLYDGVTYPFQELSPDVGQALCELLDGKNNIDGLLSSSSMDRVSLKGHSGNLPSFMGDKDCSFYPMHMPWSVPLAYPSILFQNQAEVNRSQSANQGLVAGTKRPHFSGNIPKLQVDKDGASQFDGWGLSAESPLASTLTEDDFLDMSYEEYLEVHSRCRKQLCSSATTPSWTQPELLRSKSDDNDRKSEFVRDNSSSPN